MSDPKRLRHPTESEAAGMQRTASFLVGIVGPCSSGKSTLARLLRAEGYRVKEIMQEHSAAPDMWRKITNPTVLIYLDVSLSVAAEREGLSQPSSWWIEERDRRLVHAREHCDVYIDTSSLTPEQVHDRARGELAEWDPDQVDRSVR